MAEWVATRPIFDVCAREKGYKGRGETLGAVVDAEGSGRPAEGHGGSDFGSGKGTAATRNTAGMTGAREDRRGEAWTAGSRVMAGGISMLGRRQVTPR